MEVLFSYGQGSLQKQLKMMENVPEVLLKFNIVEQPCVQEVIQFFEIPLIDVDNQKSIDMKI